MSNVFIFSLFFYWLKPSSFAITLFLVLMALIFGFWVDKLFLFLVKYETSM